MHVALCDLTCLTNYSGCVPRREDAREASKLQNRHGTGKNTTLEDDELVGKLYHDVTAS